jgi:hypothetical protein
MFFELIYTRCRQGIDLLRKGQTISNDGYKVYACSSALMNESMVDLPFLVNAVQTKQSYNDPDFMDDAYLYYVPDFGKSFLLNFFPVHFDANAQGDYSHRPGNFINQVLVGDFHSFYPFELFKNKNIWTARTKGEAYYYENVPNDIPARNDLSVEQSYYSYEKIKAFIADGRKDALTSAISFLITQYKEEADKRKFLVISDDSSEKIELWIAAIECAFSTQIASSIPFATRMDKFLNANRYTVNNAGAFQTQINLQDPNQKQRFRAMIIGIDERDRANINSAHPLANSPFVLLDGKNKRATFETDTSDVYYNLVTSFDDIHKRFCREFLPIFDISTPTTELFSLADIFIKLNKPMSNTFEMAEALDVLEKFQVSDIPMFKIYIYNTVCQNIPRFFQEDVSCALRIINWLLKYSSIIGYNNAKQKYQEIVHKIFKNFVNNKHENAIKFTVAYLEHQTLIDIFDRQMAKEIINEGLKICFYYKDKESGCKIVKILMQRANDNVQGFILSLAMSSEKEFAEFLVGIILNSDNSIMDSDSSVRSFCAKLNNSGLKHLVNDILIKWFIKLKSSSEFELFIDLVKEVGHFENEELTKIFVSIDSKTPLFSKNTSELAKQIQKNKPIDTVCMNSAHIYALDILSGKHKYQNLIGEFENLVNQNFPSICEPEYIDLFVKNLLKIQLTSKDLDYIIKMLEVAPIATKQPEKFINLISSASKSGEQTTDILVAILVEARQNEKSLNTLGNLLVKKPIIDYFSTVTNRALEEIKQNKSQSIFGKVINIFKKEN